jgi:formate dehydrogenase
VATVEGGEIVELRPDREHPVTRGFACNKGLAALDIHRDPDRLDRPQRRVNGGFTPASWDEALDGIASQLGEIIARHGSDAVASYIGNPSAFNALAGPAAGAFLLQLGARRTFSSGTQDCANKFAGSEAVFGTSTLHPIPDLEHTDYCLIIGENPRVSHMSFFSIPDPMRVLKDARRRGATIRFVNPRRIESAGPDTGDVVQIRPDTDLYLLAAMLCEIERSGGFREDVLAAHGRNVEGLRAFVRRYPPERVAEVTGIPGETIRALAREFAAAPRASAHISTGVNMGRQGTLAYWLLHMLLLVTGNLGRRGGNVYSVGFYPNAKAGRRDFAQSFADTRWGRLRRGSLPGNLLAEAIRDPERPIKALFVLAGNPLLSIGGEEKLRAAFESLELLVCLDLYRNATGELAHWLLPCADMLERADVNLVGLGLQHRPFVQWTEAVVPPRGERREEWWIFGKLAQRMGLKSPLDAGETPELWSRVDHMLRSRGVTLAELRAAPGGVHTYPPVEPADLLSTHVQTPDGRIDCCPPAFAKALERAEAIFAELSAEPRDQLKLITKRDAWMHNSWYHNVPQMKRGERDTNRLYVHPDDARARGLADGQKVRVWNEHGALELELRFADDLRPGVVALTHGWGHAKTGMRVARASPGVNANVLLPTGPGSFEPLSSMAHMTGVPVEIAAL